MSKIQRKMPTKWKVPPGYVLTWYPPFEYPIAQQPDRLMFVYDDAEPFVLVERQSPDGELVAGFNPNGSFAKLNEYNGVHPGVYALNIVGEEPTGLAAGAIQVRGGSL